MRAKRILDFGLAALLFIVLSPLLSVIALCVKLTSPGPILHRAGRIGLDGRLFQLLKFRTMVVNAAAIGPGITAAADPRVTPFGRLLRRTKLDELPQLWNVLRGEMSLVGPRPEDPRFVALYNAEQRIVLSVPPGITGEAQLAFRNEESMLAGKDPEQAYLSELLPLKLRIDAEYVRTRSLGRDALILARTIVALMR